MSNYRIEGGIAFPNNFEVGYQAPLDARLTTPFVADLTANDGDPIEPKDYIPSKYPGMIVSVWAEGIIDPATGSQFASPNWNDPKNGVYFCQNSVSGAADASPTASTGDDPGDWIKLGGGQGGGNPVSVITTDGNNLITILTHDGSGTLPTFAADANLTTIQSDLYSSSPNQIKINGDVSAGFSGLQRYIDGIGGKKLFIYDVSYDGTYTCLTIDGEWSGDIAADDLTVYEITNNPPIQFSTELASGNQSSGIYKPFDDGITQNTAVFSNFITNSGLANGTNSDTFQNYDGTDSGIPIHKLITNILFPTVNPTASNPSIGLDITNATNLGTYSAPALAGSAFSFTFKPKVNSWGQWKLNNNFQYYRSDSIDAASLSTTGADTSGPITITGTNAPNNLDIFSAMTVSGTYPTGTTNGKLTTGDWKFSVTFDGIDPANGTPIVDSVGANYNYANNSINSNVVKQDPLYASYPMYYKANANDTLATATPFNGENPVPFNFNAQWTTSWTESFVTGNTAASNVYEVYIAKNLVANSSVSPTFQFYNDFAGKFDPSPAWVLDGTDTRGGVEYNKYRKTGGAAVNSGAIYKVLI